MYPPHRQPSCPDPTDRAPRRDRRPRAALGDRFVHDTATSDEEPLQARLRARVESLGRGDLDPISVGLYHDAGPLP